MALPGACPVALRPHRFLHLVFSEQLLSEGPGIGMDLAAAWRQPEHQRKGILSCRGPLLPPGFPLDPQGAGLPHQIPELLPGT